MKLIHIVRYVRPAAVLVWCIAAIAIVFGIYQQYSQQPTQSVPRRAVPIRRTVVPPKKSQPDVSWKFASGTSKLFPDNRIVSLYGTPGIPALGALGEQDAGASIGRIKQLASSYRGLAKEPVQPALEIIATIAASDPTSNGDFSRETDAAALRPWIMAAQQAGVYVVLDLQPGKSDFVTQAKQYESLLAEPNVGLALDPEWRLQPGQQPLINIGYADIGEINATAAWLADIAKQHHTPQKLFLLHEFKVSMIPNRDQLDTSRTELAYAIQMDGQGAQSVKQDTWRVITAQPPANVFFGWKNFYQKDSPVLTPEQTMGITPAPWYVSYQ